MDAQLAEEAVHTTSQGSQSRIESESGMSGRYDVKVFFNGTWRRVRFLFRYIAEDILIVTP